MMTKFFFLVSAIVLFSCEQSNRARTQKASPEMISNNPYFYWDIVSADMNSSVPVENMSVGEVKDLLGRMLKADQQYRDSLHRGKQNRLDFYARKIHKNDESNLAILDHIIKKHGWPGTQVFGENATLAAWLVVWHHRDEKEVLSRYVPFMKAAYDKGEIPKKHYSSVAHQLAVLQSIK